MEHSIDKLKPCNCGTYSVKRGGDIFPWGERIAGAGLYKIYKH
jgi:hypothetical protein